MKRCWFGGALLALLLVCGILVTARMQTVHETVASQLQAAANEALAENWDGADQALQSARNAWQAKWRFSAAFADHEPMEEIDSIFAQAEVYRTSRDPVSLAAVCAQLSRLVEAMGEAHAFTWWNLL